MQTANIDTDRAENVADAAPKQIPSQLVPTAPLVGSVAAGMSPETREAPEGHREEYLKAAQWHRFPEGDTPGVFLAPMPNSFFVEWGGVMTPRALRVVDTGDLMYTVRLHHMEEDAATLDAILAEFGPEVRPVHLSDGSVATQWDFLGTGEIVELVAVTRMVSHDRE